jgi:hypothetical protein
MIAEIDLAQDKAEMDLTIILEEVRLFLQGNFARFDSELQAYRNAVPEQAQMAISPDTSGTEVVGWTALYASKNYDVAADKFEECWDVALRENLLETGAFHGWNWAKAVYLLSLLGRPDAREKSLQILANAITRGGQSSWFNRMRASLHRARSESQPTPETGLDYRAVLLRSFDDLLERLGARGNRFQRWCEELTVGLQSTSHDQFCESLKMLGGLLGFHASRPKHQAATDCRWRGVFGNAKELVTFEAKVEDRPQREIPPSDVGQAHNQFARADAEYGAQGYVVRGTIVTHLTALEPAAEASAGSIRVIQKQAVMNLWERAGLLLSLYRDHWSLDDMQARRMAAQIVQERIPTTGWLIRALDSNERFVTPERLMAEWG